MMLWKKDAPDCSGLSDGPLPNVLKAFIDFKVITYMSPAMAACHPSGTLLQFERQSRHLAANISMLICSPWHE